MAAGLALAKEMREHDFMGEERGPFKGSGAVGISAAKEFVLATGPATQLSVAELADAPAAAALRKKMFQFHTPPLFSKLAPKARFTRRCILL